MAEDFKRLAEKIARARQNAVDEIAANANMITDKEDVAANLDDSKISLDKND